MDKILFLVYNKNRYKNRSGKVMKIRQKFAFYNFILLLTPILLIGVLTVIFIIIFVMKFPVEQLYMSRTALLNPLVLTSAIGKFFSSNPLAIIYVIVWAAIGIAIGAVTTTVITKKMVSHLEQTINKLCDNMYTIRNGDLNFEVIGSEYDELNDMCEAFDSMRRALIASRTKEEELKRERNMLIANISHDLKTPITSIKGYIDGINDGVADTPEKMSKYLETIRSKAGVVEELVSNLSMFAKLEVSELAFDMKCVDLRDLVFEILDGYRLDIENAGIEPEIDLGESELNVMIDAEKIRRVFNNIIDNSLKYRRNESKKLSVRCFADSGYAYAIIEDDGMGINQNEIKKVFDSFYRTDKSRTSQIKGNGLGLGIAKQITEKHGGKLWLRSDGENKGTIATVCLPLSKV